MQRSQTWIIAQREYVNRLKSKAFIITTALGPLLLLAITLIPALITVFASEDAEKVIAVRDETGQLFESINLPDSYRLTLSTLSDDALREQTTEGELNGFLVLPVELLDEDPDVASDAEGNYYSEGGGGIIFGEQIRDAVSNAVREKRILQAGAPERVLAIVKERVPVRMIKLTDDGDRTDATPVLAVFGYIMGFLIYICMILYGAMVMRGVIEEKTNRISELIASSAKPFQLMLGKVVGIGALGLTQLLIWLAAGGILTIFSGAIIGLFVKPSSLDGIAEASSAEQAEAIDAISQFIPDIPISFPIYFLLFFVGGYLLYASMMAAVGSAVEQESDAQQFMWPILMPLIIPMMVIAIVVSNPDGALSVAMSLIPLFSPIIMVVRMAATNVPHWQVWLALLLLIGSFLLAIWIASRIYRIGILSYGKKPTFRDIAKWIRMA